MNILYAGDGEKEGAARYLLSDFPYQNLPRTSENIIMRQIQNGTGLWMIGGWSSFTGQNGNWAGSQIEKFLPAHCLKKDDRVHFFLISYLMPFGIAVSSHLAKRGHFM